MDKRKKIEEPVAKEFGLFIDDFTKSLRSQSRQLQEAVDIILQANGKHVRPLLVLLTAKACGKVTDDTVNSAVLLELLHTATLIHDDVIDETKQRRGVPSLNAIFDNRIAVLVGDFILSTALVRSISTGNFRIVSIISQLGRDLSEGEIMQLETAEDHVRSESKYFDVIRKKTATLLSACTEIGAISADTSEDVIQMCKMFGVNLGYCFQIKDDIFDYFDSDTIGKPTGNDIREGKVTLPLLYALNVAEPELARHYTSIIDANILADDDIASLIAFAKEYGGIEYAEKQMMEYHSKALSYLKHVPDSEAKEALILLADYVISRDK